MVSFLVNLRWCYMAEILPIRRKTLSNQSFNLLLNFEKDICVIASVLQIKHLVQCKKSHLYSKLLKEVSWFGKTAKVLCGMYSHVEITIQWQWVGEQYGLTCTRKRPRCCYLLQKYYKSCLRNHQFQKMYTIEIVKLICK